MGQSEDLPNSMNRQRANLTQTMAASKSSGLKTHKSSKQEQQPSQANNNNDHEDFENDDYTMSQRQEVSCSNGSARGPKQASGRLSSGSGESAFSSASESEENCSQSDSISDQNSEEASSSSFTSGRSSASRESTGDLTSRQLNTVCNLAPQTKRTRELANLVRVKFLDSLKEKGHDKGVFDESDLDELRKQLPEVGELGQSLAFRLISRFLNFREIASKCDTNGGELAKAKSATVIVEAVDNLRELLHFRSQYQIPKIRPDQFAKEIYVLYGMFPFGRDKHQLPVMYLRARVHRRWSHKLDESFRRYVAWQVNLITKSYKGAQIAKSIGASGIEKDGSFGICFDCLNVSYSCVDMDFLRFLVKLLVQYYPTYCRYALCVDLPWLFRSVWKLVRSWLPEDAQNTVQLITSKQLTEFINEDQIPNSMKINDLPASEKPIQCKHKLPDHWESLKSIDEFAKELNMSSNELKQFKSHVDKLCKEYEQLGAL